jgi:hypothetical protein
MVSGGVCFGWVVCAGHEDDAEQPCWAEEDPGTATALGACPGELAGAWTV